MRPFSGGIPHSAAVQVVETAGQPLDGCNLGSKSLSTDPAARV